jgi:hypothetical protein
VLGETLIGNSDQVLVERAFIDAFLVTADQCNGPSLRIEGEGKAPRAFSLEPKFVHVRIV